MVGATVAIGFVSLGVWAHHMFTVGMTSSSNTFFAVSTMLVAVPTESRSSIGSQQCTGERFVSHTPMLFCIAFLFQFLIAGLTGVMLAWRRSTGNSRLLFRGGAFSLHARRRMVFGIFAGIYYWFPKATGRMLNERLGKWHFWLLVIGFHLTFDTLHFAGILGMPRRIYTYAPGRGWETLNLICVDRRDLSGGGRRMLRLEHHSFAAKGAPAGNDPWDAWTLEWATTSPPPEYNFAVDARSAQQPAAVGSETSGRSRLEVRMTPWRTVTTATCDERAWMDIAGSRNGRHVSCLIITEISLFSIFVVAYLFYIGKSLNGPYPREVLELPFGRRSACSRAASRL